jgi:molecular chaperone HtpG
VLHLLEDAADYAQGPRIEQMVRAQSGHVPVPITVKDKPDADGNQVADGTALWTRPKSAITPEEYKDFYRSVAGQWDDPALTLHYRAEGRHEYSVLAFVPETRPFDLFDPDRKGRMKLYVRRVFITDEAEILPRYLRFVRGLVDSADLPLNMSREMIQDSPILAAIQKGLTGKVLGELEKTAKDDPAAYAKLWETFGAVVKEGLYEDFERRETLLRLARFKTTASGGEWRSLQDYVAAMPENQTAIYYATGSDLDRIASSPQLEGFRARRGSAATARPGRQLLGARGDRLGRQAVQVGHARGGRSQPHSPGRRRRQAQARSQRCGRRLPRFREGNPG